MYSGTALGEVALICQKRSGVILCSLAALSRYSQSIPAWSSALLLASVSGSLSLWAQQSNNSISGCSAAAATDKVFTYLTLPRLQRDRYMSTAMKRDRKPASIAADGVGEGKSVAGAVHNALCATGSVLRSASAEGVRRLRGCW